MESFHRGEQVRYVGEDGGAGWDPNDRGVLLSRGAPRSGRGGAPGPAAAHLLPGAVRGHPRLDSVGLPGTGMSTHPGQSRRGRTSSHSRSTRVGLIRPT